MTEATRPLRVLRIIARLNVGGPARHTAILNAGLRARGMETLLVHGSLAPGEASLEDLALGADLPVRHIPELGRRISVWSDVRAFARILSLLREWQPDIVHTHTAKAGALGRLAAVAYNVTRRRENRCAVVHTFHGHVFEGYFNAAGSQLVRVTERLLGRATDRIVAISTRQREDLTSRFAIASPEKVSVVPLGLELAELLAAPLRPISPSDRTGAPFQVGYVGRLAPIKDLGTLLAGIELARRQAVSLRLTVVGDGEERAVLERRAAELGLGDAVQFLGWRRDLAAVYLEHGSLRTDVAQRRYAGVADRSDGCRRPGRCDSRRRRSRRRLRRHDRCARTAASAGGAGRRHRRRGHETFAVGAHGRSGPEDVRTRFDAARLVQDTEALYLDALADRRGDRFAGRSATGGRARR